MGIHNLKFLTNVHAGAYLSKGVAVGSGLIKSLQKTIRPELEQLEGGEALRSGPTLALLMNVVDFEVVSPV